MRKSPRRKFPAGFLCLRVIPFRFAHGFFWVADGAGARLGALECQCTICQRPPSKAAIRPNNPKLLIPIALLIVLVVFFTNFLTSGKPYSTNLHDLRSQFNRDKGKVRLLMLLSPS